MHGRPIPGNYLFEAVKDLEAIVMAANARIALVIPGILRAARDLDSAVILELAKSECDLDGGYTGLTPETFAAECKKAAKQVGWDIWALHADHLPVKKGSQEEMDKLKALIDAQIKAGYTSFAVDASFLFDLQGKTVADQLKKNIECTTHMVKWLQQRMGKTPFGLEVEVGEVGWKDQHGMIITKPEEATTFVKALNANGVFPHVLATSNGSTHGNLYDDRGMPIEQLSIDLPRTLEIAQALERLGQKVRIAQHGVTGTPRHLIATQFPKKYISKANVGTFWMNLVYDVFKVCEPGLYQDIWDWTLKAYGGEARKKGMKSDVEVFGKYGKFAIKEFFTRIYSVRQSTKDTIEAVAYSEARIFMTAFNSQGSAAAVRKLMTK
ncbi:MAG: class II fructose-bisphosphate aldolase [Candidatus Diapherotrites archaeon]|uniref:Class II fructose-bisphosphate aldolase n=1 Tax=Candidatus Iainarchaeum sp. TaxID=3101447 RepID=A0A8T4LAB4_9ARCH|nr:class II fructose-bisphosphate aldolase [Candidatus Diapherotrites archaeon]